MNGITLILYCVVVIGLFYFVGIAPQKKEQKKKEELMSKLAVGDYVVTTSGMYGQVIDITSDMVIVEFGGRASVQRQRMLLRTAQSIRRNNKKNRELRSKLPYLYV